MQIKLYRLRGMHSTGDQSGALHYSSLETTMLRHPPQAAGIHESLYFIDTSVFMHNNRPRAQHVLSPSAEISTKFMAAILLLNGPNLNLLGTREPENYGTIRLSSIEKRAEEIAAAAGYTLIAFQSNAEHELIDCLHTAATAGVEYIVFNPAAYTHTSIALRDSLLAIRIPFIEVHLSNIHARDSFRRNSYFSDIAQGVISGLGAQGYALAMQAAVAHLSAQKGA